MRHRAEYIQWKMEDCSQSQPPTNQSSVLHPWTTLRMTVPISSLLPIPAAVVMFGAGMLLHSAQLLGDVV